VNYVRIFAWFAGFILAFCSVRNFTSWQEYVVYIPAYIAVVALNMELGRRMFAGEILTALSKNATDLEKDHTK
jgi:hypothetical protein